MSNNPSILTLQAGDQGAFSQLVNRRLLEIKQRCGTPDERAGTPDQPTQPVSIKTLRWNAIGSVTGSMSVVPILAILAHDWTGLTLFLLLLAGLICSLWRLAPRCNNASGQLRFNAYFLGATAGILAVFLLIRWDYWLAATNYPDSISGLNLAILVAGFGSLLSCYLLRHARRVKESGG